MSKNKYRELVERRLRETLPYLNDRAILRIVDEEVRTWEEVKNEDWGLGDYTGENCTNCGRERVCLCANGKTRCGSCGYNPTLYDILFLEEL